MARITWITWQGSLSPCSSNASNAQLRQKEVEHITVSVVRLTAAHNGGMRVKLLGVHVDLLPGQVVEVVGHELLHLVHCHRLLHDALLHHQRTLLIRHLLIRARRRHPCTPRICLDPGGIPTSTSSCCALAATLLPSHTDQHVIRACSGSGRVCPCLPLLAGTSGPLACCQVGAAAGAGEPGLIGPLQPVIVGGAWVLLLLDLLLGLTVVGLPCHGHVHDAGHQDHGHHHGGEHQQQAQGPAP
mmetsp:Transcript_6267/g.13748  ORF Transcript_6267/g.13748 Transcript_6267/m.13748 type:complete len:243 (+) Transcript_6267:681-1409(+)